jgi:hypothetical protein
MEKTLEIHLKELRAEIAADIAAMDISDAKAVGSDCYLGASRTKMVAEIVALGLTKGRDE